MAANPDTSTSEGTGSDLESLSDNQHTSTSVSHDAEIYNGSDQRSGDPGAVESTVHHLSEKTQPKVHQEDVSSRGSALDNDAAPPKLPPWERAVSELLREKCQSEDVEDVKFLLSTYLQSNKFRSKILNDPDEDGSTALHIAAYRGDEDIVEALLEQQDLNTHVATQQPFQLTADDLAEQWGFHGIAHGIRSYSSKRKVQPNAKDQNPSDTIESIGFQTWIWRRQTAETVKDEDKTQLNNKNMSERVRQELETRTAGTAPENDKSKVEGIFKDTEELMQELQSGDANKSPYSADETIWLHLQANNRDWIETICKRVLCQKPRCDDIIQRIRQALDSTERINTGVGHAFDGKPFMGAQDNQGSQGRSEMGKQTEKKEQQQPKRSETSTATKNSPTSLIEPQLMGVVLPIIDLDHLVPEYESHSKAGRKRSDRDLDDLFSELTSRKKTSQSPSNHCLEHYRKMQFRATQYRDYICQPLTLDQYSDNGLTHDQLRTLNGDQVIPRYLSRARQQPKNSKLDSSRDRWNKILVTTGEVSRKLLAGFRKIPGILRGRSHHQGSRATDDVESLKTQCPNLEDNEQLYLWPNGASMDPMHILVVPQLWMFQIDNVLVTSFPERWNPSPEGLSLLGDMKQLVKRTDLSNGKQRLDARTLLHNILKHVLGFKPSLSIDNQDDPTSISDKSARCGSQSDSPWKDTYLGIYREEIKSISREVHTCCDGFMESVGKCDTNFLALSANVTRNLMAISDVIHEMEIIRQVHGHQASIWKDMHNIKPKSTGLVHACNCKTTQGVWDVINRSRGEIERTIREAKRVHDRADALLTRLVGQASTESAIGASEQATYFGIFTVVTVIFTPLSLVMSLLALQIQSFTPSTPWTMAQVAYGCIGSVFGTFVLCAVSFWGFYMWRKSRKLPSGTGMSLGSIREALAKKKS